MKIHRLVNLHLPGYRSTIKVKEEFTVALCSVFFLARFFSLSRSFYECACLFLVPCLFAFIYTPHTHCLASFCWQNTYMVSFMVVKQDPDLYLPGWSLALRGHFLFWRKKTTIHLLSEQLYSELISLKGDIHPSMKGEEWEYRINTNIYYIFVYTSFRLGNNYCKCKSRIGWGGGVTLYILHKIKLLKLLCL